MIFKNFDFNYFLTFYLKYSFLLLLLDFNLSYLLFNKVKIGNIKFICNKLQQISAKRDKKSNFKDI